MKDAKKEDRKLNLRLQEREERLRIARQEEY
jgi:hypothetical protein